MSGITIKQAVQLAVAQPANAIVLEGSPGAGKTYGTIAELKERGYHVVRIDCQNVPSDWLTALPVIDKDDGKTVHMASHDMWRPQQKQAFILDELYKADKHIVDAFLPLVFGNEFMGHTYNDDTIRIITTNGGAFGLGDRELPHMGNRTTRLMVRDMTIDEATKVMVNLRFDRRIVAWLEHTPQALQSYNEHGAKLSDTEDADYFGYKPNDPRRKFCSMRTLEIASGWLKALDDGEDMALVRQALAGSIGERATNSLLRFINSRSAGAPTYKQLLAGAVRVNDLTQLNRRDATLNMACSVTEQDMKRVLDILDEMSNEFKRLFSRYVVHKKFVLSMMATEPRLAQMYR